MRLEKIVSGGQTGVDRGALEAAKALHFPLGGWYPRGSLCEDRVDLGLLFPGMREHSSDRYPPRTAANVRDSDATLILYDAASPMGKGTALTFKLVEQYSRFLIDVVADGTRRLEDVVADTVAKLDAQFGDKPIVLNVAGPRGSSWPAGFDLSRRLIDGLIRHSLSS